MLKGQSRDEFEQWFTAEEQLPLFNLLLSTLDENEGISELVVYFESQPFLFKYGIYKAFFSSKGIYIVVEPFVKNLARPDSLSFKYTSFYEGDINKADKDRGLRRSEEKAMSAGVAIASKILNKLRQNEF